MASLLSRIARKLFSSKQNDIESLYKEKDYLEAYSEHTDRRVEKDPHEAIGGSWEEVGTLQFEFLKKNGMQQQHRMLDIGCGTLRGGRHSIRYLNPGHYTGMDISQKAIEYGQALIKEEGLEEKRPRLMVSQKKDLKFSEFSNETFDFILAQSVFTHLFEHHIEECFQNVGKIMGPNSAFYFTYRESDAPKQVALKDFAYPFSLFEGLAAKYGFKIKNVAESYPHPKGQKMVRLTK